MLFSQIYGSFSNNLILCYKYSNSFRYPNFSIFKMVDATYTPAG